jgi:electron transfer flavoprotein alpha subunit
MIKVDQEKCTTCGICVDICPVSAIDISEGVISIDRGSCTLCGVCVSVCPVNAISIKRKAKTEDTSGYENVWVFTEVASGTLKPVVLELLGKGRELANKLDQKLCAVIIGSGADKFIDELGAYGAELIYMVDDPIYENYSTDAYTSAISQLITEFKPNIFLYGATHVGRDLAPSVASNLGLGLTADCTDLSIEEEDNLLLQTRPAFGGNVMADIICPNTRPQMATVRPNVMEPLTPDEKREYEVIERKISIPSRSVRTKILETISGREEHEVGVEEGDCVISGGRGMGSADKFEVLDELAGLLSGVVGCSRPIVELGWIPKSRQVGQSGKTVSPRLYIACGISGAIQHQVGIRNSDIIIAINKDPKAPIFDIADFGVVGDLHQIIPRLIEKLKRR